MEVVLVDEKGKIGVELREDLVLLEQREDTTPQIHMAGSAEDPKKYFDWFVVRVGTDVTRFEVGDKVFIATRPSGVRCDLDNDGIPENYGILAEGGIYGREVRI